MDGVSLEAIEAKRDMLRKVQLSDCTSNYYKNINIVVARAWVDKKHAEAKRSRVIVPYKITERDRLALSTRFGWNIESIDYGLRNRFSPAVAALVYCMSHRNVVAMGQDGEEVIEIDGDVPMFVAKDASYVHVCRTSATTRLIAGYALERIQLDRLAKSKNPSVAAGARGVLGELISGGGSRVCVSAVNCRRSAEVILVNHAKTNMSLAQAVAMARAHSADSVRGVAFFQPDMLYLSDGELSSFDGTYVVDRDRDIISYIPRGDAANAFSHPYKALMSFFLNHSYVDDKGSWTVEKHLGADGIFHYILHKSSVSVGFSEELEANYYHADQSKWVELSYPTFAASSNAVVGRSLQRAVVRMPEGVYSRVMAQFLAVDVKRLTRDEIYTALRNHNNTYIQGGDTVLKPKRVWALDLNGAAVAMHAELIVRRESASVELKAALAAIKVKYSVVDESVLTLLVRLAWLSVTSVAKGVFDQAELMSALDGLICRGVDASVYASQADMAVTVTQNVGVRDVVVGYGSMMPHLPGGAAVVVRQGVLARAMAFVRKKAAAAAEISSLAASVSMSENFSCVLPSCSSGSTGVEMSDTLVVDSDVVPSVLVTDMQHELLQKFIADQDAVVTSAVPREVNKFESFSRTDVVPVSISDVDPISSIQADYDRIFPSLSLEDFEVRPWLCAESDLHKNVDVHCSLNDAKREIPLPVSIRRSRLRTSGTGKRPPDQVGLLTALYKRNADVPSNRGLVSLDREAEAVVTRMIDSCYVKDWETKLAVELENGLWQPNVDDLSRYIPKVETTKASALLKEFFSVADFDMNRWMLMVKAKVKPPVDQKAGGSVSLPQTIMYNESGGMNAMYSSIMSRFHDVIVSLSRPGFRLNDKASPAAHEVWFNSLNSVRTGEEYRYEGDLYCYDRSQEHMALGFEMVFYRRHGLNKETLEIWSRTHGAKRAVSMMYGVVLTVVLQGLSGIFKTLMRNGLICWGAVVTSCRLQYCDILSLDIKGDDFLLESTRSIAVTRANVTFALTFNLSSKFYDVDVMYFCSKYWILVDGWWYWVADPLRKVEAVGASVRSSECLDSGLEERWRSFVDVMRHYDNGLVVDALAVAVQQRMNLCFKPLGLITGLGKLAADRAAYFDSYGPEEFVG